MREIKFRVWDNVDFMSSPFTLHDIVSRKVEFTSDCKIMQYIDVFDKNQNQIAESDIVRCYDDYIFSPSKRNLEVVFNKSVFFLKGGNSFDYYAELEIIGNIYQNPQLLNQ